jgi:hypothetical protein
MPSTVRNRIASPERLRGHAPRRQRGPVGGAEKAEWTRTAEGAERTCAEAGVPGTPYSIIGVPGTSYVIPRIQEVRPGSGDTILNYWDSGDIIRNSANPGGQTC